MCVRHVGPKSNTFILTNIGSASPAASGKSEAHASIGDEVCYEYYAAKYPPFGASDRDTFANQTAATSFIPWGSGWSTVDLERLPTRRVRHERLPTLHMRACTRTAVHMHLCTPYLMNT